MASRVSKSHKHRKCCLVNIFNFWGTFWTKIYVILSDLFICWESLTFNSILKCYSHFWLILLSFIFVLFPGYNALVPMISVIYIKMEEKKNNLFTVVCRKFLKCWIYAFLGTFLTLKFCWGNSQRALIRSIGSAKQWCWWSPHQPIRKWRHIFQLSWKDVFGSFLRR